MGKPWIIGYGNMGKSFAKKLRGFEVEVLFYDILENVGDANAKPVSLAELKEKSDIISLHTPWNSSTDKMINSEFINSCVKPFWFINTARGNSVVTDDLVEGLKSGKVLGAGLDVLEYEKLSFENLFLDSEKPAAFSYLLQAKNVLLTPHIAGWTFESHKKLAQVIVDKIKSLYSEPKIEEQKYQRVTGIGGFFFKSKNSKELVNWYAKHLGLDTNDYGCSFVWKDENGNDCITQWSPFQEDTNYFAPSKKEFMQNFRVQNLEKLIADLKKEGVTIVGEMETYSYGKFAWILDPEENKIELWEPIDKVFL
jgi:D-3-phosphoglycerate dehydrogenase